jgi:hypothetical protein
MGHSYRRPIIMQKRRCVRVTVAALGFMVLLGGLGVTSAQAQTVASPNTAPTRTFTAEEEARLNFLVERDRPRDLTREYYYDRNGRPRRDENDRELIRKSDEIAKLAQRFSARPNVRDLQALQALVNIYGRYNYSSWHKTNIQTLFYVVRDAGPIANDPDNRGDAAFAQERYRRYLRILAFHIWRTDPGGEQNLRNLAGLLKDCELRPSTTRSSGNNHDPSCGFWIERLVPRDDWGNSMTNAQYIPSTLADFAANRDTSSEARGWPLASRTYGEEYPLALPEGSPARQNVWLGNEVALRAIYARPDKTTRAYVQTQIRERELAYSPQRAREEAERVQRSARETAAREGFERADARFAELWLKPSRTAAEQVEHENLAYEVRLVDYYQARFPLTQPAKLVAYCQRWQAAACASEFGTRAIADYNRQRFGPDRKPGFWDNVAALAEGFAAAGEASSQSVTVRTYDAAGNFTGTQTMTRAQAMARGATPRN